MPNTSLFCQDALAWLTAYQGEAFSAIITDPPAGIGLFGNDWDTPEKYTSFSNKKREAFIKLLHNIFSECFRKSAESAVLVAWTLPRTSHWTAKALMASGWQINQEFYHIFATGMPKSLDIAKKIKQYTHDSTLADKWLGRGTSLKPAYEKWLVAHKIQVDMPKYSYSYHKKIGKKERHADNVINNHPSVKSIDLMKKIVNLYTSPESLVLDPFMGSGTTGVACRALGRRFCGVENNKSFFQIATQRLMSMPSQYDSEEVEFV